MQKRDNPAVKQGGRRKWGKKQILLLSFFLPLSVMIGCMAAFQVEPFGENSFLIIDGLHQYMPFYSILYDKLKGADSLFYSFRAGLGINFLSLFSYYLSSPLNLFILLFKKTQLNMAVSWLLVLKIALSGLTSGIYFSSKTKKPGGSVLLCSFVYALNSYMVGYSWNIMWLDVIMIFPIVLMGIERLVEKKDGRLYGAALFYALYCNYYMAFMVCIFAVLWYVLYSFKNIRQFFFRGLSFAFYSLLAAAMAAFLLLPAYLGIKETTSGGEMGLPAHGWQTGFADLLTRQFAMTTPISHDNFDGNANLYLGVFMVFAVTLYLCNKKIPWREKGKKALLLVLFYVSFSEDILNFIWHGFHNQFGIPNRFSFLFGFVLLIMLFEVLEHWREIRNWQVILGCLLGSAMLYVSKRYGEAPLEDEIYAVAGILLLVYGLIFFVLSFDRRHGKYHLAIFGVVAMAEIGTTAALGFSHNGQINVPKFFSGTKDMEQAVEALEDGTFYRSELADARMVDENAWYTLNGVGLFGSTANGNMVAMMDSLGFYTGCNEYLYQGGTPLTNLLLGVKYIYFHPEDVMHTNFIYKDTFGDFDVYENPVQKLSIGYMIDDSVRDWYYESAYPFRVQNELGTLGFGVSELFEGITISDPETTGCTASRTNDGEYYFEYQKEQNNHMIFTLPIDQTMEHLHLYYDGTQVEHAEIMVDNQMVKQGDLDGFILSIGRVEEGSTVTVRFKLKGETPTGYVRLSAADFQTEPFNKLVQRMEQRSMNMEEVDSRHISGTVTAAQEQTLFLSVPYDKGWKAVVDGKPVKTDKIGDAFLAVPLEEGEHHVVLTFTPAGFALGGKISLGAIILFVGICVSFPSVRRKREEKEERERRKWQENFLPDSGFHDRKNEEITEDEETGELCYSSGNGKRKEPKDDTGGK